ncbi:hypothetical protein CHK_1141 [Christensenella hongkongensis]|uniref:Uncharacterized protein n=1 Tax=Christensenella hongkongensis TaxID=270498 RepID=A0A0M2NGR8_9FIRM|nr:hypothetical protein CHK_1141 [Christensenella hongkongensis]
MPYDAHTVLKIFKTENRFLSIAEEIGGYVQKRTAHARRSLNLLR